MRRGKRKVFQQWAAIILVVLMSLNLGVVVSASGEGDSSPVLTGLTINGQDGLCTEDSTKISYDSSEITGRTGARTTLYVEGKNLDASQVEVRPSGKYENGCDSGGQDRADYESADSRAGGGSAGITGKQPDRVYRTVWRTERDPCQQYYCRGGARRAL